MPGTSKNVQLSWAEGLSVELTSSTQIKFSAGRRTARTSPPAAALLDLFRKPTTIAEASDVLSRRVSSADAWFLAMTCILDLQRAGLLVEVDGRPSPALSERSFGWNVPSVHIAMLGDRRRTESFIEAVRQVVRPGDVVVDIGTGTGVLAIAAAQAGAARVYAVEAAGIGKLAEANFAANGFEDRISLVAGWSMDVALPERADVLVSEIIGNQFVDEHIVEVTHDAGQRFLKPGAHMIPRHVNIFALPVAIPTKMIRRHLFTPEVLDAWRSRYGMDFTPLGESTPSSLSFRAFPWKLRGRALAAPVLVTTADLHAGEITIVSADSDFVATASEQLSGVLLYCDLELAPGVQLSTHPDRVEKTCHWKFPLRVLPKPLMLKSGERYSLTYSKAVAGPPQDIRVEPAA